MREYDISTYGDTVADAYDDLHHDREDLAPVVALLAELAAGGKALELGIGTGRVALPLAEQGIEVHDIDASEAMVAKLRAKAGGEAIPVTMGNFADLGVAERYALVFVVFNTFFNLLTQDDQVRCFHNVADHLDRGGVFLIEAFVPDLGRFDCGQRTNAISVEVDRVDLNVERHDPVAQRVTSQHVVFSEEGTRLYPVQVRYAWPSELDLMARLAGLRLRHRWSDWRRSAFTGTSVSHISVFGKE